MTAQNLTSQQNNHRSIEPKDIGRWETIEAKFTNAATHVALLPTNKIFTYGGSSLDPDQFKNPTLPVGEILDLNVEPKQVYEISRDGLEGDLWCGGHTFLEDGKLLFVGGTSYYPAAPDPLFGGLRQAYLFDPTDESWERLDNMQEGRWYPTLIRLADNSVLTIGGLQYRDPNDKTDPNIIKNLFNLVANIKKRFVKVQEIYHPDTKQWRSMEAEQLFPLYPRLHLLPDGDIFYSGVFNTHYFVPGRFPSARWSYQTRMWQELGGRHKEKNREEGISVLLALRPPHYEARILVAGGGTHNFGRILMTLFHSIGKNLWSSKFHSLTQIQDTVELIDLGLPEPRWQSMPKMHLPRIHANGVLLPNGQVAVVGGMSKYGHIPGTHISQYPVLHTEMYDPVANTWSLLAAQSKPRVYHSAAILLPDATVISMGSNPYEKMIEHTIEIFSPPYLFRGDRPVITRCPEQIAYRQPASIEVDRARTIGQVVLMRPEVVTHVTNTDQRLVELEFKVLNDNRLEIQGPPSKAHIPQGYSLIFVLNKDGVPSVGKFVQIV